nr:aldo/keto reductase [bacterium]
MEYITWEKSGLRVSRTGFGALPIQRVSHQEAARLLRAAVDAGVTFIDTARSYSDSEEKIGYALHDVRKSLVLASKTPASDGEGVTQDVERTLGLLQCDYIDIYQFHNPKQVPLPGDGTGRYEAMAKAKREGKVRAIGITAHALENAQKALESGLYDTVQYPLSCLSSDKEVDFARKCHEKGVGFIGMKGMAGGLIAHPDASFAFLRRIPGVVPIWGVQRMEELEEFLRYEQCPPAWDEAMRQKVEQERRQLSGNFCRSCGYCLPCPENINIPQAARIMFLLGRAPAAQFVTPEFREEMARVDKCRHCGACASRCPYQLDTPALLSAQYQQYKAFCQAWDKKAGQ